MFLIFGIGQPSVKQYDTKEYKHCTHCNNSTNWKVSKHSSWFTLFFIPVIPVSTKYLFHCPICNNGWKIDGYEFDRKCST